MFLTTAVETRMCHLLHSDFDTRHQNNSSPCWLTLARRPLSPCRACYRRLAFLSPSPSTAIVPTLLLLSFSLHTHIYTCSFCSHSLVFRLPLNSVPLSSTVLPFSLACVLLILGHTPTVSWLRRSIIVFSFVLSPLPLRSTHEEGWLLSNLLPRRRDRVEPRTTSFPSVGYIFRRRAGFLSDSFRREKPSSSRGLLIARVVHCVADTRHDLSLDHSEPLARL